MDDFKIADQEIVKGDGNRSWVLKVNVIFYRPFILYHFDKKLRPYGFNSGPYIFKGDRLVCWSHND